MEIDDIYQELADRLNLYPIGVPKTKELIEILKNRWEPEEASIGIKLPTVLKEFSAIAEHYDLDEKELKTKLEKLTNKGLVFHLEKGGKSHYCLLPSIWGFFQTSFWKGEKNSFTTKLAPLWDEYYYKDFSKELFGSKTPLGRIIPIEKSVNIASPEIAPYERISEIIKSRSLIAVGHCPCRMLRKLEDRGCNHSLETCLHYGDWAEYMIKRGFGREVSKDEALNIITKTEEEGLIHIVENHQDGRGDISATCCCCSCCCVMLRGILELKNVASTVLGPSSFLMEIDKKSCTGCGACVDRCLFNAVSLDNDTACVDHDLCMGCGVCESTCAGGAVTLKRRNQIDSLPLPDFETLMVNIMKEKGRI